MSTITTTADTADTAARDPCRRHTRPTTGRLSALSTLARRRLALTARTPRELLVPLMAPLLFAVIVAPALADTFGATPGGIDYMTFVAVSTIGLLVPLNSMTAGLGVIVDRLGGARRDLLAAPIPRSLIVVGNLVVAVALSGLQVAVLIGAAALRGAEYELEATGMAWFVAAALVTFAVAMYGVAEVLANRIPTQEEYIGALPPIAIVPFFVAGGLFSHQRPARRADLHRQAPAPHPRHRTHPVRDRRPRPARGSTTSGAWTTRPRWRRSASAPSPCSPWRSPPCRSGSSAGRLSADSQRTIRAGGAPPPELAVVVDAFIHLTS